MKVPILDLCRTPSGLTTELTNTFARVLASGHFILGPEVSSFEAGCAAYLGSPHTVAVSSGTDALLMALMALNIGPGDEVICPTYTFFGTAGSIWRVGATPIFVDSLPCCYNLDPGAVAAAITPRTKAIMPVHLYGQAAEMTGILALAGKYGLAVIEDAAQSMGARFGDRQTGTLGTIGCYSFYPTKNLGALGDAGLLTTNDPVLAEKLKTLRMHGSRVKYMHEIVGGNFRIDALQAAFLRIKLPHLDEAHAARARNAARYTKNLLASGVARFPVTDCLCGKPGSSVEAPLLLPFSCQPHHIYNQYVIRITGPGRRDALRKFLTEKEIGTEIYYPLPLHQQECFSTLASSKKSYPWSERFSRETLALPIFPELRDDEIDYVSEQIGIFLKSQS